MINITPRAGFTVTAHTGSMHTRANSAASVAASIRYGADITEMDVTFRKDGTPVIIHSASPKDNEGLLFSKALEAVAKSDMLRMNLDLKAFWNTAAVQNALIGAGLLERAFYTGVFEKNAKEVRNGSPLVPYYINASLSPSERDSQDALNALAERIRGFGGVGLNIHYPCLNHKVVEVMHEHGLLVSAWTVHCKADMEALIAMGVDNITTKNPAKLRAVIGAASKG